MNESWLPVVGYEGVYEVSSLGNVRRVGGRILALAPGGRGNYSRVRLSATRLGKRPRTHTVHALVLEAFVGPRPKGMEALHDDDDGSNNALDNLRWGTRLENARDKIKNGKARNANLYKTRCLRGHKLVGDNLIPNNRGQRLCRACRDARLVAMKENGLPPGDPRHGTRSGFLKWGCRCDKCRVAESTRKRAWRSARRTNRKEVS